MSEIRLTAEELRDAAVTWCQLNHGTGGGSYSVSLRCTVPQDGSTNGQFGAVVTYTPPPPTPAPFAPPPPVVRHSPALFVLGVVVGLLFALGLGAAVWPAPLAAPTPAPPGVERE